MSKQLPFCFAILPTMTKNKAIVKKALFLLLTHSSNIDRISMMLERWVHKAGKDKPCSQGAESVTGM